ncbi:hypothetical protein [Streptomyces sp. AK02-01A]|uniref:hypothetical protein n=1 Tax=Streptomyces sp. AK02-01A TaxID=3028648 RepID=UPI0029A853C9|nr:hypothetical protein [Streptomyces sp. AK02-01A]MDX3855496.1 hypothetical protein [Streptomyces sp. AK02-01A]
MTSTERPHESTSGAGPRRRRRSPLAVAAVTAAVLVAGGGGVYFATSAAGGGADGGSGEPGGDGAPPPLALDTPAGGSGSAEPPGIAPGEPDPSGVTYRARGELPDGPGSARVHRTNGEIAAAEVARLARALGVAGAPRLDGTVWKVGTEKDGSGPLLRVERQAPGAWTFARFRPSPGSDNCLRGKSCPSDGGGGSGAGPASGDAGRAVSEAAAKKAAAPVLKALGQEDAGLDARQLMGAVRVVNADPVVGGLPTYGWSTGIQVGADGRVAGGSGKLTAPEPGDSYPVVGADEALKALNKAAAGSGRLGGCATAMPLDDARPAAPCGPRGSAAPKTMEIGKAVFGLAPHSVDGRAVLVPSWLFEVAPGGGAQPYTVTQPALAPRFLKEPAPPRGRAPGGSAGSRPGAFADVISYSVDGRVLTLRFSGGVCSPYSASADEGGTAVKVKVAMAEPAPDTVCVALAKFQTVSVTLDRPLGDRLVVDGRTGEKLPPS